MRFFILKVVRAICGVVQAPLAISKDLSESVAIVTNFTASIVI